jgi:hypothetical protein
MNASIPSTSPSTTGCSVLAQLTLTGTNPVIQAMFPICPSGTLYPSDPSTGATVNWPLSADGTGAASQMVIYGQMTHVTDRTDVYMAQAGCALGLTVDQVQYLLGRSLTWNNNLQELWDNTGELAISTRSSLPPSCSRGWRS